MAREAGPPCMGMWAALAVHRRAALGRPCDVAAANVAITAVVTVCVSGEFFASVAVNTGVCRICWWVLVPHTIVQKIITQLIPVDQSPVT